MGRLANSGLGVMRHPKSVSSAHRLEKEASAAAGLLPMLFERVSIGCRLHPATVIGSSSSADVLAAMRRARIRSQSQQELDDEGE